MSRSLTLSILESLRKSTEPRSLRDACVSTIRRNFLPQYLDEITQRGREQVSIPYELETLAIEFHLQRERFEVRAQRIDVASRNLRNLTFANPYFLNLIEASYEFLSWLMNNGRDIRNRNDLQNLLIDLDVRINLTPQLLSIIQDELETVITPLIQAPGYSFRVILERIIFFVDFVVKNTSNSELRRLSNIAKTLLHLERPSA